MTHDSGVIKTRRQRTLSVRLQNPEHVTSICPPPAESCRLRRSASCAVRITTSDERGLTPALEELQTAVTQRNALHVFPSSLGPVCRWLVFPVCPRNLGRKIRYPTTDQLDDGRGPPPSRSAETLPGRSGGTVEHVARACPDLRVPGSTRQIHTVIRCARIGKFRPDHPEPLSRAKPVALGSFQPRRTRPAAPSSRVMTQRHFRGPVPNGRRGPACARTPVGSPAG